MLHIEHHIVYILPIYDDDVLINSLKLWKNGKEGAADLGLDDMTCNWVMWVWEWGWTHLRYSTKIHFAKLLSNNFFVDEKTCQINSIFWSGEKYIIVRQKGIHEPTYMHEKYRRIGMYVWLKKCYWCLYKKRRTVNIPVEVYISLYWEIRTSVLCMYVFSSSFFPSSFDMTWWSSGIASYHIIQ